MPPSLLLPLALLGALCAVANAGEPPPILSIRLADGPALVRAWEGSLYGRVWAHEDLADLRAAVQAWREERAQQQTPDPLTIISGWTGAEARWLGLALADDDGSPAPHLVVRCEPGPALPQIRRWIEDHGDWQPEQITGADEAWSDGAALRIARYGPTFVLALHGAALPFSPTPSAALVEAAFDGAALRQAWQALPQAAVEQPLVQWALQQLAEAGTWRYRADLVADGLDERLVCSRPLLGAQPVDRAVLARLPAQTMLVWAIGIDGRALWPQLRPRLLSLLAALWETTPAEHDLDTVEEKLQRALELQGCSLAEVVAGCSGTSLWALTPGMPVPGITLAIPRSAGSDALLAALAAQAGIALPAAEGAAIIIPSTAGLRLPVMLQLLRGRSHWVLSSDPLVIAGWERGDGGFAGSAAAQRLFAAAPEAAHLLAASDTPALLDTIGSYMALVAADESRRSAAMLILTVLARLREEAVRGYAFAINEPAGWRCQSRGLIGIGPLAALVAGAAVALSEQVQPLAGDAQPAEEHVDAAMEDPAQRAQTVLRDVLYAAEQRFQAECRLDQDGDGVGEYATLPELLGAVAPPGSVDDRPCLLPMVVDAEYGYHYAIYVPTVLGLGTADRAGSAPEPAAADLQEQRFVIYAWPVDAAAGLPMYALDADGQLYTAPFAGEPPAWNALFGPEGWHGTPTWQPVTPERP
ncbi:MAG: hypothetical protein N3B15_01085 [Planctomycetota bacterium]|nr:hypothetical protein [Planctomycetota bacterium]